MANAKKCDRCGVLYEIRNDEDRPSLNGQTIRRFSLISTALNGNKLGEYDYDLCSDCACAPKEKED